MNLVIQTSVCSEEINDQTLQTQERRTMPGLSRRSFLTRGSLLVAVGSVVTAVPGLGSVLQAGEEEAPELSGAASEGSATGAELTAPLVAHIKDLQTGEISIYQGEQQFTYKDPGLAARIYQASR
jgi:hypothetical protein